MGRRRKYCGESDEYELNPPIKHRNTANARERARMRVLSKAFVKLKTTLPWVPPDTKLSKLDTLRLASSYIAHLRQLLMFEEGNSSVHPVSLTWPFVIPMKSACSSTDEKSSSAEDSNITLHVSNNCSIKEEQITPSIIT